MSITKNFTKKIAAIFSSLKNHPESSEGEINSSLSIPAETATTKNPDQEQKTIEPVKLEKEKTPTISLSPEQIELSLRPTKLSEFIGQDNIKADLRVFLHAALISREALDHVLLFGPPGMGKTTLGLICAYEMGAEITSIAAPVIESAGDLAAILTNLNEGDVLFIDEIHRLDPAIEEVFYPAWEDYILDFMIGQGTAARSIKLELPRFTLIGSTNHPELMTAQMHSCFGITFHLDFYSIEDLQKIIMRSADIMQVEIETDGAEEIARRSRGTPRIANRLLRLVHDFAEVNYDGRITKAIAKDALDRLESDGELTEGQASPDYTNFFQSPENKYIKQFAKKYGTDFDESTLSKLQLLISDTWNFSISDLKRLVFLEVEAQKIEQVRSKIFYGNPTTLWDYIHNFLASYQSDDEENLFILHVILKEENLYQDFDELKTCVNILHKIIEAERFKNQLLDNNNTRLDEIDNFSGYEFEAFLKQLFGKMGYRVEQTKLSGDQGADLVVIKFGEKTVIQAKRYGGKIGNFAVQEIMAAISLYKAQKGMVITNSYFTPAAKELAKANNIELIDRDSLENLIENYL